MVGVRTRAPAPPSERSGELALAASEHGRRGRLERRECPDRIFRAAPLPDHLDHLPDDRRPGDDGDDHPSTPVQVVLGQLQPAFRLYPHFDPDDVHDMCGSPPESVTDNVYDPAGPDTVTDRPPAPDAAPVIDVETDPAPDPDTVSVTGREHVTV